MTIQEIKAAFKEVPAEVGQAADYCFNEMGSEVDEDGDVWIPRGQGVWLDEDQLRELAGWIGDETGQHLLLWSGLADEVTP